MGLQRALLRIAGDRSAENLLREVLGFAREQAPATFSAEQLAGHIRHDVADVAMLLSQLEAEAVLVRDGGLYRYPDDAVVDLDVRRFLRSAQRHHAIVQTNVERFRQRFRST